MQINNSSLNPLPSSQLAGKIKQTDNTLVNNQREQTRTKEQNNQQDKAQSSAQTTRFDVDQQAITRVEQFNQQRVSELKLSELKSPTTNTVNSSYDQPSQQNQFAVNSYRSIENITQRESIQQTFGVDLFV